MLASNKETLVSNTRVNFRGYIGAKAGRLRFSCELNYQSCADRVLALCCGELLGMPHKSSVENKNARLGYIQTRVYGLGN